jgi:hypothetical protein
MKLAASSGPPSPGGSLIGASLILFDEEAGRPRNILVKKTT